MKIERVEGDVPLHLEVDGVGPPVVLMHGFGGSARNFRPQARALRDRYRVALFDLRGHARSGAPKDPSAYAPECFVEDVRRVLGHLGAERATVGGLSLGAGIAARFARAHPDRTRALVLAAPPPAARERGQARWALAFADDIEREGLEAAGERFAWGPDSGFDRAAARLIRMGFLEHPPHGLAGVLRGVIAHQPPVESWAPELARLGTPTLVVVGSEDAISRAPAERIAHLMPRAELVVIEGAGHVVNLAAPEAFDRALRDFLDRVHAG